MNECQWFAGCHNLADKDVHHPTLGWIPTCDEHVEWVRRDPSLTKYVPPMVARNLLGLVR